MIVRQACSEQGDAGLFCPAICLEQCCLVIVQTPYHYRSVGRYGVCGVCGKTKHFALGPMEAVSIWRSVINPVADDDEIFIMQALSGG